MATSLRAMAGCIGVGGDISVVRDFYGYRTGRYGHKSINVDITTITMSAAAIADGDPATLSLLRQFQLLKTRFVNLDVIRVGGDDYNAVENRDIDVAVQVTRELYERVDIGIGRVHWSFISVAQAGSYMSLDSRCETEDLIDDWDAPFGGVDCFFVRAITYGAGGGTPEKGDGLVVQLSGTWGTGLALAHELGHYLGIHHHLNDRDFLMVGGGAGIPRPPYKFTSGELQTIRSHAAMRGGCS